MSELFITLNVCFFYKKKVYLFFSIYMIKESINIKKKYYIRKACANNFGIIALSFISYFFEYFIIIKNKFCIV